MDNIERPTTCAKCKKHLPTQKELERIQDVRRIHGQLTLERLARRGTLKYCVCLGFQADAPESISEAQERTEDGLSHEDQLSFQVVKRSVGLDPRIDRPLWCYDDVATRLVLHLQYPPEQFEEMYELIRMHWRGTATLLDRRRDMMELRKRGENVFGENTSLKAQYLEEDASLVDLEDEQIFRKLPMGWFYFRKTAFDVIRQSQLRFLQRERHLLHWSMWNLLRAKTPRRERYKMSRTQLEWISWMEKLRGLLQEAKLHPGDYPFMTKLWPFSEPELGWRLLRELFWEGTLHGLFSLGYLVYVFRECGQEYWRNHDRAKFKGDNGLVRFSNKHYADIAITISLLLKSSIIYVLVLGCLMGLSLLFRWHPSVRTSVLTICLMIPFSIWAALLTFAISLRFDGKRIWFRLFTFSKLP